MSPVIPEGYGVLHAEPAHFKDTCGDWLEGQARIVNGITRSGFPEPD